MVDAVNDMTLVYILLLRWKATKTSTEFQEDCDTVFDILSNPGWYVHSLRVQIRESCLGANTSISKTQEPGKRK